MSSIKPIGITADGLVTNRASSIATYSGGWIDPLDPDPADINIQDIAHALAMQTRYTGHLRHFYSIAEHSVHVARIVPRDVALAALMHDAAEAYLGDLARPIKHSPGLGEAYQRCELRLEEAIAKKFGLHPPPMIASVKEADRDMNFIEAQWLLPHLGELLPSVPKSTPLPECWGPEKAEAIFLSCFAEYGGYE